MIHAQNVFYYDIESRLEERLECRFQEMTESGDTVTVRKSVTLLPGLVNLHNLKEKLTEKELKCMGVARCKSHQPTLLCVENSMQSVKRHFCESECDNVITNFFSWIMTEILKPMNCRKDQRTITYLWCIMDLHMIPNSFIRMPTIFLVAEMYRC